MSDISVDPECTCMLEIATKQCSKCSNASGNFTCHGCCHHFCPEHAEQHRVELTDQLRALVHETDRIDVNVRSSSSDGDYQRAVDKIESWRLESIRRIEALAVELKAQASSFRSSSGSGTELSQLIVCRDRFSARLREAQRMNNFHDRHIRYWRGFLEDLQQNFRGITGGSIKAYECGPFIEKLCVSGSAGQAKIRFSKWCEYQETCLQIVDVRRTGEYREGNCKDAAYVRPCTDTIQSSSPVPLRNETSYHDTQIVSSHNQSYSAAAVYTERQPEASYDNIVLETSYTEPHAVAAFPPCDETLLRASAFESHTPTRHSSNQYVTSFAPCDETLLRSSYQASPVGTGDCGGSSYSYSKRYSHKTSYVTH